MQDRTLPIELSDHKRRVASVYNLAAPGYDKPAVRFFRLCAQLLVDTAELQRGQRILDIATGTGAALLLAARAVGSAGWVTGIDIAEDMLAQAQANISQEKLENVNLLIADADHLPFEDSSFDAVLCASSIFFLPDLAAALREWVRGVRPGGVVAFQGYGDTAFEPQSTLFERRIRGYGVTLASPTRPFSWQRLTAPDDYHSLLEETGCTRIIVREEQVGYFLTSPDEWWDIVWNSGFRGPVAQLAPDRLDQFKREHLAEVAELASDKGIWLDVPAIAAVGTRDAER